jgi:energy-coupling factor transporter transmembrane protein EcfT
MEKFNPQIPVRYGLIAFAFILTLGLMMYVFYQSVVTNFAMLGAIFLFAFALVLFLAIWSGISYRRENGGVISFGHAFGAVYLVFVLSSAGNILTQQLINKVIDKQYAEKASQLLREKMEDRFDKMNMDEDKAKETMKNIGPENFDPPAAKVLQSTLIFLAIFALVSAIIAAFIKRGSGDLIASGIEPEPIKTI